MCYKCHWKLFFENTTPKKRLGAMRYNGNH